MLATQPYHLVLSYSCEDDEAPVNEGWPAVMVKKYPGRKFSVLRLSPTTVLRF